MEKSWRCDMVSSWQPKTRRSVKDAKTLPNADSLAAQSTRSEYADKRTKV